MSTDAITQNEIEHWSKDSPPTSPAASPGTRCGSEISGGGVMSYRCQVGQGHLDRDEPHYCEEVHRTVKAWQAWARKHWEQLRSGAPEEKPYIATRRGQSQIRACGQSGCDIQVRHVHGLDRAPEPFPEPTPAPDQEVPEPAKRKKSKAEIIAAMEASLKDFPEDIRNLYQANREDIETGEMHWPFDPECEVAYSTDAFSVAQRCFNCRPVNYQMLDEPAPDPKMKAEPTRTRPGDQVLPTGDDSLVDDQALLIADIEGRREVGIERYGQGHRPFNGRNTIQDWYEEQLDGLVYARSILRMSEASREDLVEVAKKALLEQWEAESQSGTKDSPEGFTARMSEVAVDSIMGWVTGQQISGSDDLVQRLKNLQVWAVPRGYLGDPPSMDIHDEVRAVRFDEVLKIIEPEQ